MTIFHLSPLKPGIPHHHQNDTSPTVTVTPESNKRRRSTLPATRATRVVRLVPQQRRQLVEDIAAAGRVGPEGAEGAGASGSET